MESRTKALSVKQPWAHLIATGVKILEVRSWSTNYRGELIVCASATPKNVFVRREGGERVPLYAGCAYCVVDLVACRPMRPEDAEEACSDYESGAFVWVLENPQFVRPEPIKGRLGLWDVTHLEFHCLDNADEFFAFDPPAGNVKTFNPDKHFCLFDDVDVFHQ